MTLTRCQRPNTIRDLVVPAAVPTEDGEHPVAEASIDLVDLAGAYTVKEAAEVLRLTTGTVYELIREGSIPHVRVGHQFRIGKLAFWAYLNGLDGEQLAQELVRGSGGDRHRWESADPDSNGKRRGVDVEIHFTESYGFNDGKKRRSYHYDIKWRNPKTGEEKRKFKRSFRSKAAAKRASRELMAEVERNGGYFDEEMAAMEAERAEEERGKTVAEFVQFWADQKFQPGVIGERSIELYETNLRKHILPRFGSMRLKDVTPLIVQKWIGDVQKPTEENPRGYAPYTVRFMVRTLQQVMNFAVDMGELTKSPVRGLIQPGDERRQEVIVGTVDLVNTALAAAKGKPLYAPIHLAFSTGLRRGELGGLQWADINFETGKLTVARQRKEKKSGDEEKVAKLKTKSSYRTISVPTATLKVLEEYKQEQQDQFAKLGKKWSESGWIFCSHTGEPYTLSHLNAWFGKLMKKAGYPGFTLHMARSAHATILAAMGKNPRVVQRRLGHASIVTTLKYYTQVSPGMDEDAADSFDDIIE